MFRRESKKPIRGIKRRRPYYELPVVGHSVHAVEDDVPRLVFDDVKTTTITIEYPKLATFRSGGQDKWQADFPRLQSLVGEAATKALADDEGF